MNNSKCTEDKSTQVSQSDSENTNKPLSKESSPCASVKRKRRKKRRLSVEPTENLFTYQSDRVFAAKSVMREEDETKKVFQCQREPESHQQLETQSLGVTHQSSHTAENMTPPPSVPRGLRRMSKNITVQNLHSLESDSFSFNYNSQSTPKSHENICTDNGYLPEDPVPKGEPKLSSMIENFKFSISDIYSYFFSEKQADSGLDSPTEDIVSNFTDGDTVPENYDHFFSEFDTDNFFYTEEVKSEMVPIFSCSRSSKTKIKLRDGYDYFLVSSSDNSSTESDEEDVQERAPIRVVTRFTRKESSKDIVTDAYEQFYTDRDLKEDFFKTTFSFRNVNFNENEKNVFKDSMTLRPLKQKSNLIRAMPITVLGNQDLMFPDSVLCNFDDQTITKLQQPLIYENLQTAVANPNLDAPLLPLKQSDMCLICIAFASWVLKTANPQVGDTWKAVLLANVSALSAIRYLRKYVKSEATAGEKKPNLKALTSS
ncbi:hypothetical protein WMY93_030412 [Mugilogobius chulae]|uniref:PGC-1 and ERR-induced regulator in muscle protein 1 n=1 Tax=Mugilogobius chulae TaxID=88201 RepID=A0AAW0MPD9_9GOBI